MIYKAQINGLPVEAYYSEESIENIFLPLLKKLTDMYEKKGQRALVMLAAPPGSGKSTLVHFLEYLSKNTKGVHPITTIGMDGFHRYQEELDRRTMMRAGKECLMAQFKGAPETFDLDLLKERVIRVSEGEHCGWPEYYRIAHNPIDDAIVVDGDIILLEGNYLLLDWEGWDSLAEYADYTIKIVADEEFLKKRLVSRKAQSGISLEEAEKFVEKSDLYNVRTCLKHSKDADLTLYLKEDNTLDVKQI